VCVRESEPRIIPFPPAAPRTTHEDQKSQGQNLRPSDRVGVRGGPGIVYQKEFLKPAAFKAEGAVADGDELRKQSAR